MDGVKRKLQIGVLLGNSQTEHPKEIIAGIYDVIKEENVQITFFLGAQGRALDYWSESVDQASLSYVYQYNSLYDYALIGNMDALVIAYGTICIYLNDFEQRSFLPRFKSMPLILLERYDENSPVSYVITDNYISMRHIVEHLVVDHGYKKVLHLSGPNSSFESILRKRAYLDVMLENGLSVTDSMIGEGDYTPNVTHIVEKLLNDNPDAEAINCANDEMAIAAYRVCKQRGLVVGRDIAVTGYDDIDSAAILDPPLTTANQDGTEIGFKAVKAAIEACEDKNHMHSESILAPFIRRGSCGCDFISAKKNEELSECYSKILSIDDEIQIEATAQLALSAVKRKKNIPDTISETFIDVCKKMILFFFKVRNKQLCERDSDYINKSIITELRILIGDNYDTFTEYINLNKALDYIRMLMSYELSNISNFEEAIMINQLDDVVSNYMETLIVQRGDERADSLQINNWSIPSNIQNMMEKSDNSNELFKAALVLLKDAGIKTAFICLNRYPVIVKRETFAGCPDKMCLVGKMIDGSIESFDFDEAPTINRNAGFSKLYPVSDSNTPYSVFLLFQEEMQFGLLICETDHTSIDMLFGIALQISTSLAFFQLRRQQEKSRQELYKTLKTLEEKNKVLSFVSSSDQMTNLYNRRGFMEKIFAMLHEHEGKRAFLFFFDLDHLKEINDIFGHSEGDFALTTSAEFLRRLFGENGFCARLGGDEFVGVKLEDSDNPGQADQLIEDLKNISEQFNATSIKPFYIEFSAGYTGFVFNEVLDIDAVLKNADNVLYEAKKKRRETIRK